MKNHSELDSDKTYRKITTSKAGYKEDVKQWMKYRGTPDATVYVIPDIGERVSLVTEA